ncbi:MAG: hypothetical protein IME93_02925 [Proteobacteria bacterium]|nr:hypothetical protein [Pseudomonadota bacterium]
MSTVFSLLLNSCVSNIDRSAFSAQLTYAVVTFGLTPEVLLIDEVSVDIKPLQQARSRMLATKPVASRMATEFIEGFVQNAPMKIIYGRRVTDKKQYQTLSTAATPGKNQYIAVGDYYNYTHEESAQSRELASVLNVDGVIMIYSSLEASGTAVLLPNKELGGTYKPAIHSHIVAYNKNGKRVINRRIRYKSAKRIKPSKSGVHYLELRRTLAGYDARLAGITAARKLWGGLSVKK